MNTWCSIVLHRIVTNSSTLADQLESLFQKLPSAFYIYLLALPCLALPSPILGQKTSKNIHSPLTSSDFFIPNTVILFVNIT